MQNITDSFNITDRGKLNLFQLYIIKEKNERMDGTNFQKDNSSARVFIQSRLAFLAKEKVSDILTNHWYKRKTCFSYS